MAAFTYPSPSRQTVRSSAAAAGSTTSSMTSTTPTSSDQPTTSTTEPPSAPPSNNTGGSSADTITSDNVTDVRNQAGSSSTHLGITLAMSADLGNGPGAIVVSVHVHAASGAFRAIHVTYGDLEWDPKAQPFDCGSVPASSSVTESPFDYDGTFTHVYAAAGAYHLEASTTVASQCPAPDGEVDHWSFAQMDIDVPSGFGANGPKPPELHVNREDCCGFTELFPDAWDDDGWISTITLDWGDGSPPLTFSNDDACTTFAGFSRGIDLAPGGQQHHYAAPGTYTAILVAQSTACDGSSPQTVTQAVATHG